MAILKTSFIGPAYESRSRSIDLQECVNLYPEIERPDSKSVIALIGTPGLELYVTASNNGPCRKLRQPLINHSEDPLFHRPLAFLDAEIDNPSRGITGDLAGPARYRHPALGVVAVMDLGFTGIGQQMPIGKPQPQTH